MNAILLLAHIGCQVPLIEESVDDARYLFGTSTTRPNGLGRVLIDVQEGESSFTLSSRVEDPLEVFVRRLTDPTGVDVLIASDLTNGSFSKTNAVFIDQVSTLNWPVSDADGPLIPGRYEVELGVVDADLRFVREPALVDILLKQDADLQNGTLNVVVFYTDGLEQDSDLVRAVDAAKVIWQQIYALAGVQVTFTTNFLNENGLLPPAFGEDDRIADISSSTAARSISLILSDVIEIEDFDVLGIAGDIPGPLIPTARSAVQLSMSSAAGDDGQFDELDTRILAETMAHETAHFLGLFHPVERDSWDHWDVLEDTAQCDNEQPCVEDLGSNLMFPFPVCGFSDCTAQSELTADQRSVLNLAVAVR